MTDFDKLLDFYKRHTEHLCESCKNYIPCKGKECEHYESGIGATDEQGNKYNWKWDCRDFNYGECEVLENTPCKGCFDNDLKNFDWNGKIFGE